MPCNACRRDPRFIALGLPQEGLLVSTDEVVRLLREHREIAPPVAASAQFLPQSGTYLVGESIPLLHHTGLEGNVAVEDADGSTWMLALEGGANCITLTVDNPVTPWLIPQGRCYVLRDDGIYRAFGGIDWRLQHRAAHPQESCCGRRLIPEIQRPYAFAIDNNDDAEASSAGATFLKNDLISFHRIVETRIKYFLGSIIIESNWY